MARNTAIQRVRKTSLRSLTGQVVGAPTVTQIAPSTGPAAGGTSVSVLGTRFVNGLTTVTIGGNACTGVNVVTATSLQCVTPAGSGTDDAVVTTPYGSGTLAGGYVYTGGPVLWTPLFFSDNRIGGTGRSVTALRDGTKWTYGESELADGSQVIAAPVGAPSELAGINVLQLVSSSSAGAFPRLSVSTLGTLADTGTRNYRFYIRFDQTTGDSENHPMQDGSAGVSTHSLGFYTYLTPPSGLPRTFAFRPNSAQTPDGNNHYWYPTGITHDEGQWARVEYQIKRSGTDFTAHAWEFYGNGTLRYAPDSFLNNSRVTAMPDFTFGFASDSADSTQVYQWGSEGLDDVTTAGVTLYHEAALAIVDGVPEGEFIGPYGSCTGENG